MSSLCEICSSAKRENVMMATTVPFETYALELLYAMIENHGREVFSGSEVPEIAFCDAEPELMVGFLKANEYIMCEGNVIQVTKKGENRIESMPVSWRIEHAPMECHSYQK